MSRMLAHARRFTALAATTVLLLASADSALAAAPGSTVDGGRIYACVTAGFRTLNLTTRGGRCTKGQQKISWAVEGPRGKTGARGPSGKTGKPGPTGPAGPVGETGAQGPAGPAGPAGSGSGAVGPAGPQGPIGATGPQGNPGSPGRDGTNGRDGVDGRPGVDGRDGAQGLPGVTLLASSAAVTLTTQLGGVDGQAAALPLSGVTYSPHFQWAAPAPFALQQVVAGDVTLTRLWLKGRLTGGLAIVGSTLHVDATLMRNDAATALSCEAVPALTGLLAIGAAFEAACTGSAPLTAGDLAYVRVRATITAGLDIGAIVPADVTVGLA